VPVPATALGAKPSSSSGNLATSHPESITEELSAADLAALNQWRKRREAEVPRPPEAEGQETTATMPVRPKPPSSDRVKVEAGLRVCPRCGKPVHLSAIVCRECGAHVPKK
jgi:ribosomal protein L32